MPGPCSRPVGVIRPRANVGKRTLKRVAAKARTPRALLDPQTGRRKGADEARKGR